MISYVSGGALVPPHPHSEALYRDHEAASAVGKDHSAIREIAAAAIAQPSRKPKRRCSDVFNRPSSALIGDDRVTARGGIGVLVSEVAG